MLEGLKNEDSRFAKVCRTFDKDEAQRGSSTKIAFFTKSWSKSREINGSLADQNVDTRLKIKRRLENFGVKSPECHPQDSGERPEVQTRYKIAAWHIKDAQESRTTFGRIRIENLQNLSFFYHFLMDFFFTYLGI